MIKKVFSLILVVGAMVLPVAVLAEAVPSSVCTNFIATILNNILYMVVWPVFLGIVIICFVYSGILYLTAHGEPSKITAANHGVVIGIVGIIIVLLAYVLINAIPTGSCTAGGGGGGPNSGACCTTNIAGDGTYDCNILAETACSPGVNGGTYSGNNTTCTPWPCAGPPAAGGANGGAPPANTGACCNNSGVCTAGATAAECTAPSGTFQGAGSTCTPNPCSAPTGACCGRVPGNPWCLEYSSELCAAQMNAEWLGAGTVCSPNPC